MVSTPARVIAHVLLMGLVGIGSTDTTLAQQRPSNQLFSVLLGLHEDVADVAVRSGQEAKAAPLLLRSVELRTARGR